MGAAHPGCCCSLHGLDHKHALRPASHTTRFANTIRAVPRQSPIPGTCSFGVVLLEILTGLPPIFESLDANESTDGERQMTSLARWCAPYVQTGNVAKIVDPRLGADYPVDIVKAMAEVAMACVQRHSKNRPDTGEVVRRLGDILARLTGDESAATLGHLRSQSSNVGAIAIPEDGEIDPNIALVGNMEGPYDESTAAMSQIIPR
ncbi:unnamed protein product [Closterium sp. Naga37s-1]|nr:unnamed protein product [Closterium sp. Naga37s-1]